VKKLKDKGFAAKVDREEVYKGIELLGVNLNDHIEFIIEVLRNNREDLQI
jgi:predicted hydrolase (HD superfamily)